MADTREVQNDKMWTYSRAVAFLDEHINLEQLQSENGGVAAGKQPSTSLGPVKKMLEALGDPHLNFKTIHITGTNGKGSTAQIASCVLRSMGLSVGLFTSPHLAQVNERLNWDGNSISDQEFTETIQLIAHVAQHIEEKLSWFELLTVAAYIWFADKSIDVAVVEVGMLGEYDATNVIEADVAVVTNIAKDHTDGAAGWEQAVAKEKAGIIKPNSQTVLGQIDSDLVEIFEAKAESDVWLYGKDFSVDSDVLAVGGRVVDLSTPGGNYEQLFLELHGKPQASNLATAIMSVEALVGNFIAQEVIEDALSKIHLPGRFDLIAIEPTVIFDCAHNPAGAQVTIATLETEFARLGSWVLVIAILNDRDPIEMLEAIDAASFDAVICTEVDNPRALPSEQLARAAASLDIKADVINNPVEALVRAQTVTAADDLVLVTGSSYLVGELSKAVTNSGAGTA